MIKEFVIKNLLSIHYGDVSDKVWSTVQLAAAPVIGVTFGEKILGWYIDSQMTIVVMIGLLLADLFLGAWKHWKLSTFSFGEMFKGFLTKAVLVVVFYLIKEALIQILSDAELDSVYVKVPLNLIIFIYLGGNALVNMGIISNGKIPPAILLKRMAKFNTTLNVDDLIPNKSKDEKFVNFDANPIDDSGLSHSEASDGDGHH